MLGSSSLFREVFTATCTIWPIIPCIVKSFQEFSHMVSLQGNKKMLPYSNNLSSMEKEKCSRCQQLVDRMNVIKYSRYEDNQYYLCNPCNTSRLKKYRKTHAKKTYAITNRYERKNTLKCRAWRLACKIAKGPCESCGEKENVHRHHDDYRKPLEVIFLCAKHHSHRHRTMDIPANRQ